MDKRLASRLVCPVCASDLRLDVFDADSSGVDVREGVLLCDRCKAWYPVHRSVPVLLDFRTPLHERFVADRSRELTAHPGFAPPAGTARPGEESVQQTFTEEWGSIAESDLSFTHTVADLESLNRHVWLTWLAHPDARRPSAVLDVGCGLGDEAVAVHNVTGASETIAVELNFALIERAARGTVPEGVHFVIASLFALPFAKRSFDLVYSQGVLHHTYSTAAAFEEVASFVADGGHLFVWVYGRDDHLGLRGRRRLAMRATLAGESALRPLLSRASPAIRTGFFAVGGRIIHPVLKPRMRHRERWELSNTDAFLRDILSPRYAHRHGYNEVIEWFERLGFAVVATQSPRSYRELFGDRLWGVGLTGERMRAHRRA